MDPGQVPGCLNVNQRTRVREIHTDEKIFDGARIFSFVCALSPAYGSDGVLVFLTIREYHHEVSTYRSRSGARGGSRTHSCHLQCID